MSQINKITILGAALFTALLFGCGDPNSQAPFSADSGQHAAGWLPAGHMVAARADLNACAECHGSNFAGGIAGVSCTQCHLGGAGSVHPAAWSGTTDTAHGAYVTSNGNTSCANAACHGPSLTGVSGSGPSCTSCHLGGAGSFHPQEWGGQAVTAHGAYVTSNGNTACANAACHGPSLTGVSGSGPSCTSCHIGGADSFHPQDWGAYTYSRHAGYVSANGNTSCANAACHGPALSGGIGPSCTSCHLGGVDSVHPADWDADILNHADYVASNGAGACANAVCHGENLQGVVGSGPSCSICH